MPVRNFFRVGDRVIVHNYSHDGADGDYPGRIVCTNRANPYGLNVIALVMVDGAERPETFMETGRRYTNRASPPGMGCYLSLGKDR